MIDANVAAPVEPSRRSLRWAVAAALGISIALVGSIYFASQWPRSRDLKLCDQAIQATLKAPATYKRVSASDDMGTFYRIEYDAENSFGVPLRGSGYCTVDDSRSKASWIEKIVPNHG